MLAKQLSGQHKVTDRINKEGLAKRSWAFFLIKIMSDKSKSIANKNNINQDERLKKVSPLRVLLNRPELGALGGSILVFIFFGIVAGDIGMFSAYGTLNFLDVSANLGIIAIAAAMLMIGGEFDLSIGSMIGFAGICIAIPAIYWGWPFG